MKKPFALLIVATLICHLSYSQKDKGVRQKFMYSVVGGLTMSSIGGESDSWKSGLLGGQFGIMINYDHSMNDKTVLGAEVNYSMQGSKWEESNYEGKVVASYINFPMVIQHRRPNGPYGEIGIQPGFLVSAKDKYDGNSDDFKDYMNSFDFGIPVGIGYIFFRRVGVNLRYVHGLSNVNKDSDYKDRNRVFALRIFWVPGLNK